jgi:hypothetical protein
LSAYNILIEGYNQALENDIVLTMKQGNVAAASRIVDDARVREFFLHEGHRTVVSLRALQVDTDPLLGHTTLNGAGYAVAELSPYEADLDWSEITEPDQIAPVLVSLGRATAKIHCVRPGQRGGPGRLPNRARDRRSYRRRPVGLHRGNGRLRNVVPTQGP